MELEALSSQLCITQVKQLEQAKMEEAMLYRTIQMTPSKSAITVSRSDKVKQLQAPVRVATDVPLLSSAATQRYKALS